MKKTPRQLAFDFGDPPLTADQYIDLAGECRDFSRVEDAAFALNPHIVYFVREHRAGRLSKEEALVGMVLSLSFANNNIKAAMGEMLAGRDPLNVF